MRENRALAIIYLFVASITAAYGLLNACTRFRLPLDPYLIVFAALTMRSAVVLVSRPRLEQTDSLRCAAAE